MSEFIGVGGHLAVAENVMNTMPPSPSLCSGGHHMSAEKVKSRVPPEHPICSDGHARLAERSNQICHPGDSETIGAGQAANIDNEHRYIASPDLLQEIKEVARYRKGFLKAETAITLRMKAFCRSVVAEDNAEFDLAVIRKKGDALFKVCQGFYKQIKKTGVPPVSDTVETMAFRFCGPMFEARDLISTKKKEQEKALAKLAQELPVWSWVESVNGFGAVGLGLLISETGDLSNYPKKGHLFKRLGVTVINGERQQKKTDKELALLHGCSPTKRALVWQIGDSLLKKDNLYKLIYDQRKAFEMDRDDEMTRLHAHRRAARYATKRLILDLWRVWGRSYC